MISCEKINVKLLPMKIVMFGWFGACACALPYMTVHMKELGLTVEETAVVYTILPITQFFSSPIAGFIADRLGKYRDVLLISILMTIICATALLYVPPVTSEDFQELTTVSFACDGGNSLKMLCDGISNISNYNSKAVSYKSIHLSCNNSSATDNTFNTTIEAIDAIKYSICGYKPSAFHLNKSLSEINNYLKPLLNSSNCSIICYDGNFSPEKYSEVSGNRNLTFSLYCIFRIVYNIFSAIGFTLVNSSAIALTETSSEMGEYGRQRLWAMVAMAIFSPLAGVLVDIMSTDEVINYAPAFHLHNILALLTGIAVWFLNFEMEDAPASYKETFKTFWMILRSPSIFFLLVIVFWLGTMWGFLESFLFWFMHELNSPTYMLGLTITVGSIVGLPFLYYARFIVHKVGHANLLSIAVLMYMVRCIGCSFLVNPWWVMPFEALEIFTYHLMWVAAATYAAHLSPSGFLATIQGFIEGIHYGVGQGSGSLIGGSLMSAYGSRAAFQVMGGVSGIFAVIYAFLHFVWLRKENVMPRSRQASIKSYSSQKQGRKNSSLSYTDVKGATITHSSSGCVETMH